MNYEWQKTINKSFNVSIFDLNVVNTTNVDPDFAEFIEGLSENFRQSFEPSIISSVNAAYIFNNNDLTKNKRANFLRLFGEMGGLIPGATQSIFDPNEPKTLLGLPYYQFVKSQIDVRTYQPVNEFATIAFRFNGGIGSPYGNSTVLPYEKYFFAGGLNSIRAWAPRRLGPGGYRQTDDNGELTYSIEQPGEIILESSIEFRSKIVGFVHGATFIDVGNVWTISEDTEREGSAFQLNSFYKQIAVGTGVGLRLNFSFLIFRFDVGVKVYDPARNGLVPLRDKYSRTYNIGLGYPF